MKFLLLMHAEAGAWPPEEHQVALQESIDVCNDLASKGQYLDAAPLDPQAKAAYLRVRSGKSIISDGPFLEAKEHVGGYFLIDVANLDEAIAVAARLPGARRGTAEIRQIMEVSGLPDRA